MVAIGNFLFHYRNMLFPVIFILLVFTASPQFPLNDRQWDTALDLVGFLVALAGQGLRFLTIGYDYIRRGGVNRSIYANNLVTGGMFAHSRNPLYVGNFLIFVGIMLIINAPTGYLIGIPFAIFTYAAIIAAEENYLRNKFGQEYIDYCQRVNRLLPAWQGFSGTIKDMEFSWKRVIVKEYNTTFSWLISALALIIWDDYSVLGDQAGPQGQWLAYGFVPLILAYLLVWSLKKSKRLQSD